jgi:hypothetical protein
MQKGHICGLFAFDNFPSEMINSSYPFFLGSGFNVRGTRVRLFSLLTAGCSFNSDCLIFSA